jgi:hypothetical protein
LWPAASWLPPPDEPPPELDELDELLPPLDFEPPLVLLEDELALDDEFEPGLAELAFEVAELALLGPLAALGPLLLVVEVTLGLLDGPGPPVVLVVLGLEPFEVVLPLPLLLLELPELLPPTDGPRLLLVLVVVVTLGRLVLSSAWPRTSASGPRTSGSRRTSCSGPRTSCSGPRSSCSGPRTSSCGAGTSSPG